MRVLSREQQERNFRSILIHYSARVENRRFLERYTTPFLVEIYCFGQHLNQSKGRLCVH